MTLTPIDSIILSVDELDALPNYTVIVNTAHGNTSALQRVDANWHPLMGEFDPAVIDFNTHVVTVLYQNDDTFPFLVAANLDEMNYLPDGSVVLISRSWESSVRGIAATRVDGKWMWASNSMDFASESFCFRGGVVSVLWSPET